MLSASGDKSLIFEPKLVDGPSGPTWGKEQMDGISIELIRAEKIVIQPANIRDLEKEKALRKIASEFDSVLGFSYLPIFYMEDGVNYKLIGRRWVYAHLIYSGVFEFLGLVIKKQDLALKIQHLAEIEFDLLSAYDRIDGQPSRATETRHKAINSGQTCPFCRGPLRRARGNNLIDGKGYKISCENKSRKGKECTFEALLTAYEHELFCRYELPTNAWLVPSRQEKCPLCDESMYTRTIRNTSEAEQLVKRCKSRYTANKSCVQKQL